MLSNPCYIFTEGESVRFRADVNTTRSVYFQPISLEPYIFSNKRSNKYQICGPLIKLMVEFAIRQKSSLVLKRPPVSRQDFRQQLSAGLPDIILTPWIASEIIPYLDGMRKYHLNYQATTVVDYLDENVIVARTRLGTPFTMFSYFTCFAPNVWLAVFVSLVVLAVVLSVGCGNTTPSGRHRDTCPKRLYESLWNLSNILYQKSLQNFLQKLRHRLSPALVIGVWLVSALVLSIEFTSFLLDYMHRSVPILAVDSLRELTEWDDMRLYVSNVSSLYSYVMKESATDPLARAINDRMILYSTTGWLSIKFALQMLRRLMSGSYAMTTNRLTAIFILFHLVEIDNRVGGPALQDVLHVSRYGSEFAPFFMAFNADCQQFITNGFNQMILSVRESDIYGHWVREMLHFYGRKTPIIRQSVDELQKQPLFAFNSLTLGSVCDLFYLWAFGLFIASIVSAFEILFPTFLLWFNGFYAKN